MKATVRAAKGYAQRAPCRRLCRGLRACEQPYAAQDPAEEPTPPARCLSCRRPQAAYRAGSFAVGDGPPASRREGAWHAERSECVLGVWPVCGG